MTVAGRDILPAETTELEKCVADLQLARISALDVAVIRQVVDPATCPEALLPWLAWSMSVDVWDDAWDLATKRAVIAAAPEVHRRKGTRLAVRLALEALGFETDILEWWEAEPPARRGTFKVTLWAATDGRAISAGLIRQLRDAVRGAKPKSRVFSLHLGARVGGSAYAALAPASFIHMTVAAEGA